MNQISENKILKTNWWKEAVVYQIYPRSFYDTNGDGIGDLKGITSKIDYLVDLGIDAIWLCPINESPNDDNGYDVSNYKTIMKEMGTLEDFDEMLEILKKNNIKLIMDLVLNHSSDEHEWFLQSKSSRENKYRDYYHWWPAEKGKPPYRFSLFDENADAWMYDKTTESYYLHYFSRKQPDLNWENPAVRNEMYDIMKYWLDKGVSGFRLDAFPFMAKDHSWPEIAQNLELEDYIKIYGSNKNVHVYLKEMHEQVFSNYENVYTVGEGGAIPFENILDYVHENSQELNTLYHDELINIWGRNKLEDKKYEVGKNNIIGFKSIVKKWHDTLNENAWNTVFLGNHDQSRAVSKFGNDSETFFNVSAKMLFTFLLTQKATPYIYNGDEIGMSNIRFTQIEQYDDIQTKNRYYLALKENQQKANEYLQEQQELSRDNARTPIQWNSNTNAGFSAFTPWIKLNENYKTVNVENQILDSDSILSFVKNLIRLRKTKKEIFVYGDFEMIEQEHPSIFAYIRKQNDKQILVLLNFTKTNTSIELSSFLLGKIICNNHESLANENGIISLLPYQAVIVETN